MNELGSISFSAVYKRLYKRTVSIFFEEHVARWIVYFFRETHKNGAEDSNCPSVKVAMWLRYSRCDVQLTHSFLLYTHTRHGTFWILHGVSRNMLLRDGAILPFIIQRG